MEDFICGVMACLITIVSYKIISKFIKDFIQEKKDQFQSRFTRLSNRLEEEARMRSFNFTQDLSRVEQKFDNESTRYAQIYADLYQRLNQLDFEFQKKKTVERFPKTKRAVK